MANNIFRNDSYINLLDILPSAKEVAVASDFAKHVIRHLGELRIVGQMLEKDGGLEVRDWDGMFSRGSLGSNAFDASSTVANAGTGALGDYSFSTGVDTTSSGKQSVAEGKTTLASGESSHSEGNQTVSSGSQSHAEGYKTTASGNSSHTEGYQTVSSGSQSHSEGNQTVASGNYSHTEGYHTKAIGNNAHSEGFWTIAEGYASHAEGQATTPEITLRSVNKTFQGLFKFEGIGNDTSTHPFTGEIYKVEFEISSGSGSGSGSGSAGVWVIKDTYYVNNGVMFGELPNGEIVLQQGRTSNTPYYSKTSLLDTWVKDGGAYRKTFIISGEINEDQVIYKMRNQSS